MRRSVLLVQPSLQPPGGGNGVAAWMLQALAPDHDVTVLSWWPVDVDPINRFFGTSLRAGTFTNQLAPASWRHAVSHLPIPAALLRNALLMRYTRRLAGRFDVVIGAHNEVDYGRRGIQYVHYPTYVRPRPDEDLRWYHRFSPLLHGYYHVADRLAGFSLDRVKSNVTLANSDWTAAHVRRFLEVDARTLYPPVVAGDAPPPWESRAASFVAVGRISPEKEFERLIRIVAAVRRHQPAVTLTIVGTYDRHTDGYFQFLRSTARAVDPSGSLVTFQCNLARGDLRRLLAAHRYGLHGMRNEHFGMAPAEMVRAGMIVWVPNGGGQTEIVGDAPDLIFDDEHDAVEKIVRVTIDPSLQQRYRQYLAQRSQIFSSEHFVSAIQELVATFTS
jgi:glycosyltransferase involved in cell wall biosynthesis